MTCHDDGVAVVDLSQCVGGAVGVEIQNLFDQKRDVLGAKRSHGNGQVQIIFERHVQTVRDLVQYVARGVFTVREAGRNVYAPMGKGAQQGIDPFTDRKST